MVRISLNNLSSSDIDDFIDAFLLSISKTLNTTFSDSIATKMILVHQVSSGKIIFFLSFFQFINIFYNLQPIKSIK